jgi:cohesin complex subunit SA-1/2
MKFLLFYFQSNRFNDRILEDKDCENIYELVYHSHRQVAQAAGEFLNQKLFHKAEQPLNPSKKRSQNTAFMHLLVQFFIESEVSQSIDSSFFRNKFVFLF